MIETHFSPGSITSAGKNSVGEKARRGSKLLLKLLLRHTLYGKRGKGKTAYAGGRGFSHDPLSSFWKGLTRRKGEKGP